MSQPTWAVIKVNSMTFGGTDIGVVMKTTIETALGDVLIFGQGAVYPNALGTNSKIVRISCDYMTTGSIPSQTASPATIVINTVDTVGTVHPRTALLMKPRGYRIVGVIQGEEIVSQEFIHISTDGSTDPVSIG